MVYRFVLSYRLIPFNQLVITQIVFREQNACQRQCAAESRIEKSDKSIRKNPRSALGLLSSPNLKSFCRKNHADNFRHIEKAPCEAPVLHARQIGKDLFASGLCAFFKWISHFGKKSKNRSGYKSKRRAGSFSPARRFCVCDICKFMCLWALQLIDQLLQIPHGINSCASLPRLPLDR